MEFVIILYPSFIKCYGLHKKANGKSKPERLNLNINHELDVLSQTILL